MALTRFAIVAAVFIGAAWSPTATAATWIAAVGFGAYVVTVAIEDRRAK